MASSIEGYLALRSSSLMPASLAHRREPVFVTKNGAGDLAVMDIGTYEQLMARLDLLKELSEGHRDVLEGRTHDAREGARQLRTEFGL